MSIRFAILVQAGSARFMPALSPAMITPYWQRCMTRLPLPLLRFLTHMAQPSARLRCIAAADDIDAVVLCTPTDLHAQQIELFARADKAVFCEKPIDLDSARVRDCLKIVHETDATLMVGFNRRFDPHFMGVRAAIEDGRIEPEMGIITCVLARRRRTISGAPAASSRT